MQRRDLLKLAVCSAGALAVGRRAAARPPADASTRPIIDAHIHLFDTSRTGGVPWPTPDDTALYKPATPERYMAMAEGLGVVGVIAIEASPLPSDNQWLLDVAAGHTLVVGVIGDLVPGSPTYLSELEHLHRSPMFLGIRYGNLWNRNLAVDINKPGFVDGLKALAQAGLVFESANPDPSLIRAILAVADQVPGLRIVIDHLPHAPVPAEQAARQEYWANLRRLAQNHNVFVKLSEIPAVVNGTLIKDPGFYQAPLDAIWNIFGDDHILFGSDWPNSDHVAPFADTLSIVHEYIARKSPEAAEKYFHRNSFAAYQWCPRRPDQFGL